MNMKKKGGASRVDYEGFASVSDAKTGAAPEGLGEALPCAENLPATNTSREVQAAPAAGLPMVADNRGMEDVDSEDLIIPRAQLLQPTAEGLRQLTKDFGVMAGDVINNLTKEKLPGTFVPVFYWKEFLRFNPRKKEDRGFIPEAAPGALIWRTKDANDPRVLAECSFGPNGETPVAITSLNFFCLFTDQPMPVILSFSKTSYRAGKNLLSLAKLRGGAMFSRKYRLSTDEVTNDQGTYFVLKVNPAANCTPEELAQGEMYFQQFGLKRDAIKTHDNEEAV